MEIFETGSGRSKFLCHKAKEEHKWWSGEDNIDFKYILFDLQTVKTGIGRYSSQGGYEYKWADIVGSKLVKPDETWKNAFSVWCFVDSDDEPLLWNRHSYGEYQGFLDMFRQCYVDMSKNTDKVACFEYEKSIDLDVGMGTSKPVFKFVDWKDRPEKFVIPSWDNESAETPVEGKEEKKFDEIPF
jgi:hypothetical protein